MTLWNIGKIRKNINTINPLNNKKKIKIINFQQFKKPFKANQFSENETISTYYIPEYFWTRVKIILAKWGYIMFQEQPFAHGLLNFYHRYLIDISRSWFALWQSISTVGTRTLSDLRIVKVENVWQCWIHVPRSSSFYSDMKLTCYYWFWPREISDVKIREE